MPAKTGDVHLLADQASAKGKRVMRWIKTYRLAKRVFIPIIGVDRFAKCRLFTLLAAKVGREYMKGSAA